MLDIQIIVAAVTSIILFVFGLEHFSKEVQAITGERFRTLLAKATKIPILGVLIGAIVTAFIQSSSATSIIAISLVNAGVLSFKNSVGIIFGANIGTTVTAQLVAFKLTAFAPMFIIVGFLLSFVRSKYSVFAKSLFYFGFVFFSLNLISSTLSPLQSDERIISYLTSEHSLLWGVMIGALVTAVLQSSSVTTGLAIIFTQQGLISLDNAIPILMGANIGTTVTAMISIFNMDIAAKKTALVHLLFNVGGVLLFLPFASMFGHQIPLFSDEPAIALANFHLIFNLCTSLIFIMMIRPFTSLIDRILGEGKMDFERIDLNFLHKEDDFEQIVSGLKDNIEKSYLFVKENYNLITLSIESNYKGVYEAAQKRIEYMEYIKKEQMNFYSRFVGQSTNDQQINAIVKIMSVYEYIFQIHDSVKDISFVKGQLNKDYIELKSDLLVTVRKLSGLTSNLLEQASPETSMDRDAFKEESRHFQRELEVINKNMLQLMSKPNRSDVVIVFKLITYSQRLKDKLVNYHKVSKSLEAEI